MAALAEGMSIEAACALAGIHRDTYYSWRKRPELAGRIDAALATAEAALLATVRAASNDDWRAAAWILERRYPDTWARRDHSRVVLSKEPPLPPIDFSALSDDQLARIANGEHPATVLATTTITAPTVH